jgi:hypothetical protein
VTSLILDTVLFEYRKTKDMADRAIAQLDDAQLFFKLSPRQNSIAAIMRHLAGNMLSRFTDFLTTDGEKPWRHRESEFDDHPVPRAELLEVWERGWKCLLGAVEGLSDSDLTRIVTIRNEPHTVFKALNRQTAHCAYHVGQILLIAKHVKGDGWNYLTVPPGKSEEFNRQLGVAQPERNR